jgi:quinohemoprotein ethanol dehydrogenase
MRPTIRVSAAIIAAGFLAAVPTYGTDAARSAAALRDDSPGDDWAAFGRTYGEQHYSPLADIDTRNVKRLGLAWAVDLPRANGSTGPVAVDGVVYVAAGLSIVHAIEATTGRLLWTYDPKVHEHAGRKMRTGWGSRGIAYWNGKVYTGTKDGRLIAIDAKTGQPVWSVLTVNSDDSSFISGPPRVFDGKVIIGFGGADFGDLRGYVTTYDAETGKRLWRFYTVPGNPAKGFEDAAMEMAAKTWSGEWWRYGGGGTVWNAITYDAELDTIILGTGNGAPWNHRIRSAGEGDNLFLSSIVGLDAKTGAYKWHYQTNPAETWDYNAAMDMHLADLEIGGERRKVLLTAPKNGFFYVIDRTNGRIVSAEKIAKVTWATHIDLATGRPVEIPESRYPNGTTFVMWPSPVGAHTWLPSAYSPQTRLAYVPVIELSTAYNDVGIDLKSWQRYPGRAVDGGTNPNFIVPDAGPENGTSSLLAWDPVRQKKAWQVPTPGYWNGGLMVTAGDLVFQGQIDRTFNAYDAKSGKRLWRFAAEAPVLSPPITYRAGGRQYVTVVTGMSTSGAAFGPLLERFNIDYRTQARRVLTFVVDGKATLPQSPDEPIRAIADPTFVPDAATANRAIERFGRMCATCHGVDAIAAGAAPDLRASAVPQSVEAFAAIVRDGALEVNGMPRFEEFDDAELDELRQYIRTEAAKLRDREALAAARARCKCNLPGPAAAQSAGALGAN